MCLSLPTFNYRRDTLCAPRHGFTALLFAARAGRIEAVKALLAAGAEVDEALSNGVTPLLLAVLARCLPLVSGEYTYGTCLGAAFSSLTSQPARRFPVEGRILHRGLCPSVCVAASDDRPVRVGRPAGATAPTGSCAGDAGAGRPTSSGHTVG